jgi:hypothetical protein
VATTRRPATQLSAVDGTQLTVDTERWLSPMLVVLLLSQDGGAAFARIVESVMIATVIEAMLDDVSIGTRSLDWVRLGQLVRAELGWDHYPSLPPDAATDAWPVDDSVVTGGSNLDFYASEVAPPKSN